MRARQIAIRSLTYYWRTNVAVVLGVATAVSVLAGALLVGDSVRGSLRDLLLGRLGRTDHVIASTSLFREQLAQDLVAQPEFKAAFSGVTPLVIVQGTVTAQNEGRRMSQARVYGVDDRFWRFHGVANVNGPANRDALISPALARQIDSQPGDSILVRIQRPTDIPLESLHGQRDNLGRSMRLTVAKVVPADSLGEFSLEAQQGEVAAVFVPLARLQQDLEISGRVNTLLVSTGLSPPADAAGALRALVRRNAQLEDLGYSIETLEPTGVLSIGSAAGLLDEAHAKAATSALQGTGMQAGALFTYLANSLRVGDREVPYSLVTALDLSAIQQSPANSIERLERLHRAERLGGDGAEGSRRRHGHDGVLRVGGTRSSGHKDDDVERGRRRADRSRRSEDGADVSGHHGFADVGRLGSALPGGLAADP